MPQSGVLRKGLTIKYDEVMKQDGHVWVGYNTNSGKRVYLPVRTWNESTGELGPLWGTIKWFIHNIYNITTHKACYGNKRELIIEFPFVIYYSNSIVLTSGTSGIKACLIFI